MIIKILTVVALFVLLQSNEAHVKNKKHVVCYVGTWSTYRQSLGKYDVADIDPFLCTHLMYAFFGIEESGVLRIIDPYLDLEENSGRGNIRKFNELKLKNPTLRTLASVGGWNEGSKNFSIVAHDPEKRSRFVKSAVKFVQRHGFDGIDLDWEYPNQRNNLDNNDRVNFVTLLKELKEGLSPFGYLLTAAVASAEFSASLSYNIPEVAKYLDIINVMTYDLHGPWDEVTGMNSPLYAGASDKTAQDKQLNIDAIVKYWLSEGAPPDKLVVGVPFYGHSYTLEDANQHTPGSPIAGSGIAGQYSLEPGVIGYNELCEKMLHEQWIVQWDNEQMVPYAYQDRQWISYDSLESIALKVQYIKNKDLAGVMIWSIDTDDFHGICGNGKYPLLKQINRELFKTGTATGMTSAPIAKPSSVTDSNLIHSPASVSSVYDSFKCQNEKGYVRDSKDCSKFYFCDAGNTYNFQCPYSLKFDLKTSNCNYANYVHC